MPRRSLARYCLAAALALLLAACEAEEKPYVTIHGGGFVFNYRVAAAYDARGEIRGEARGLLSDTLVREARDALRFRGRVVMPGRVMKQINPFVDWPRHPFLQRLHS